MFQEEYYQYRRRAELNLLGHTAILAYYEDDSNLFTPRIEGKKRTYPVFAPPEWIGGTHPSFTGGCNDEFANISKSVLQNHARLQASIQGDELCSTSIEDYIWNGGVQAVSIDNEANTVTPVESDYFTKLSTEQAMVDEVLYSLYQKGVPADASFKVVREAVAEVKWPLRDSRAPSFQEALSSPLFAGSSLLTAFNTGDDTKLLFGQRSHSNLEAPGVFSTVPSGVFSTENIRDNGLLDQHLTEYGEELFNLSEEESVFNSQPVCEILTRLQGDGAKYDHLGTYIDPRRISVDFAGLLYVEDPTYYTDIVTEWLEENHEHSAFELVSVQDRKRLDELLGYGELAPYDAFSVVTGLKRLTDEYNIDSGLEVELGR